MKQYSPIKDYNEYKKDVIHYLSKISNTTEIIHQLKINNSQKAMELWYSVDTSAIDGSIAEHIETDIRTCEIMVEQNEVKVKKMDR